MAKESFSTVQKNHILIIVMAALFTAVISLAPLLKVGLAGSFLGVDPDAVYVGNALSYVKAHQIHYFDHPGTPSIRLLAFSFWPLRVWAKLSGQSFLSWAVANFSQLYFYTRLLEGLLLALGTGIFMKALYRITHSGLAMLLGWLSLLTYSSYLNAGLFIAPEGLSFFLTAAWLYLFVKFIQGRSPFTVFMLSIVAGLALANKFSNLFLLPGSLVLIFQTSITFRQKCYNFFFGLILAVATFIIATLPIINNYVSVFGWIMRLATRPGLHGAGAASAFSLSTYLDSLVLLIQQNYWIVLLVGTALLVALARMKNWLSIQNIVWSFGLLGFLVFAKYPVLHYQLANFVILIFLSCTIIFRERKGHAWLLLLMVLPIALLSVQRYLADTSKLAQAAARLDSISREYENKITIWEWARAKDFSLIWGRSWSGGSFDRELLVLKPKLLEFTNFNTLRLNYYDSVSIDKICWQVLFIQNESLLAFKEISGASNISEEVIADTGVTLVKNLECF